MPSGNRSVIRSDYSDGIFADIALDSFVGAADLS